MDNLHKQEQDNTYIIEFNNFKVILINEKLADIVSIATNHSTRDKNFTSEETREMINEFVQSRIASEKMIIDLEKQLVELAKENETLYFKWQDAENFIESNRRKLEE